MSTNEEQVEMPGFKPNANRYVRLSQPFESWDEASAAIEAFGAALEKIREEHRIADLVCAVNGRAVGDDGEVVEFTVPFQCGDALRGEALAAYLYGHEKRAREQIIASVLTKGGKKVGR